MRIIELENRRTGNRTVGSSRYSRNSFSIGSMVALIGSPARPEAGASKRLHGGVPGLRGRKNDKFDIYFAPYGAHSALHGDRCSDWPAGRVPRGLRERPERNQ